MTLSEATAGFINHLERNRSTVQSHIEASTAERALRLLADYFFATVKVRDISTDRLRDFLGRWYVDAACGSRLPDAHQPPEPREVLDSLIAFFKWADMELRGGVYERCFPLLAEMSTALPRAFEISKSLSSWLQERRGAFSFPEFLTSFEGGGLSHYDIDDTDDDGGDDRVLDGYFRILDVQGSLVEAEELITGNTVRPIVFPAHVAALLSQGYTINLEIVRMREGWQITGCGFAYPPGTEV
jgi:hypothetical protein